MSLSRDDVTRSAVSGDDPVMTDDAAVDETVLPTVAKAEDLARDAMEGPGERPADPDPLDRTYRVAVTTLTTGFRIGGTLLVAGLILAILRDQPLHDRADPLADVLRGIGRGEGPAVVDLAIMALIATPVIAALAICASFTRAGDRVYAILSLTVLLILGTSITLALVR